MTALLGMGISKPKITRVKTVEVRGVNTGKGLVLPWDPKQIPQDSRDYVVTQIFTDQGVFGTTMDGDYQLPKGIGLEVQGRAEAYFTGKDPFDIEAHSAEFFQKQKAPVRLFFLEVALWDIIGRMAGQPLYRIWGAKTNRVQPYAATVHFNKTPQERAEDAIMFRERGFRAMKLRMHHLEPKGDLALAETVMKATGGRMHICFDANMAGKRKTDPPPVWEYNRALDMARALDDMGAYWLEEPLPRNELDDLARIRKQLKRMHLAGAEGDVGLARFRDILAKGSFSYIQPDPMIGGPVSVIRKIASMAEGFGVLFGPHHAKSGVGMLTNLHMQCSAPNTGYLEYMIDPGYWNPEGFQAGFTAPWPVDKAGYVYAPEAPGLGVPWDRGFCKRHGLEFPG
jgi:L-alanine-DL-glutamate epimerase-like enolase superfamily enzyme